MDVQSPGVYHDLRAEVQVQIFDALGADLDAPWLMDQTRAAPNTLTGCFHNLVQWGLQQGRHVFCC